ncbi:hypothetical protein LY16_02909 [Xenorhabdus doucetiae]|uniref:Uncharacterized protein n=1 Tax=Xenorhabdus doucetiae TaxID=351671 RepID=A0ABY3NP67_9GAMM|nr:hypothetical protein LY16_02909 [Xenorhabdus doucetiae]
MITTVWQCDKCRKILNIGTTQYNFSSVFIPKNQDVNINSSITICQQCFFKAFHSYARVKSSTPADMANNSFPNVIFRRKR